MNTGVTEREDTRLAREHNLEELADLGLPYLPNTFPPTRPSQDIKANFEALEGGDIRVAGRLMRVRLMGKAAFAHVQDGQGQIQLYFKRDVLGDQRWAYFKLLDIGDVVGAHGRLFKTRTGEITVEVHDLVLLAKSYLPLPDKWHGMTDVEMRYRRRYLDLISNEDARRIAVLRSAAVRSMRRFLDDRGFMEVETPVLQPLYGGAAANPFVTQYQALDMQAYLRISDELYLKRLIVGGFERVYEIGKDFRNEGISRKHSPEFTMLELYQAYADFHDIMALTEEMVASVAATCTGATIVEFDGHAIDLAPPWKRLHMRDAVLEATGIDIYGEGSRERLLRAVRERGVGVPDDATRGRLTEELFSEVIEPTLIAPTFVYGHPVDFPGSLLAKRNLDNPDEADRFECFAAGMELGNAFTELNDPRDQRQRMEEASQRSGEEHQNVDADFLLALEYGMPPTGGLGVGIERLVMLLAGAHHIREVVLFPLLRPRED